MFIPQLAHLKKKTKFKKWNHSGASLLFATSRILDKIIHMKYMVSIFKFAMQLKIKLHDKRTHKVPTLIEVIDKPFKTSTDNIQTRVK